MTVELVKTEVLKLTIMGPASMVEKVMEEPLPLKPGRYEVKSEAGKVVLLVEKQSAEITKG